MCNYLSINIHTTAAESPWSDEIIERDNQTLANMMGKVIIGLKWVLWALLILNAKNSLQSIAGFSPFQLKFGYNADLPATMPENLPVLSMKTSSKVLQENLDAMHKSCTDFIASENDVRIKRALEYKMFELSHKIKHVTGHTVLYQRDDSS